ncbi:NACHT domain-containing protein [Nonomuraea sp. C10]|uniref:NACHT domain-containing protein n=1 Tax=Nonomuraea sp. C10 TaxID=2600577 RepID=UPI0011CEA424|nr:NACHT domain-containing protein [Nonomuraea sp. C10]TXK42271.1 NACHT domain-containing protein [Nonomuraea sp. C10]
MTAERPRPPGPGTAGTADFVRSLALLRQWAGEPSLSRLRVLGGQTPTADGTKVDALPKSTTSHVLRQTDRLPRWDFVRAFVTACFHYCDHPPELIPAELERWRAARAALAEPAAPAPEPPPADVPPPDPAVRLLARRVLREEDRARKGLLGGYSLAPLPFGPDDASGGGAAHDLHAIGRFFGGLRPRRLLVVGESGAGKTVLAVELVLQLLEPLLGGRPGRDRPVPVRLNAARWTLGRPFESWLAEQLAQQFGLAARDAHRLVRDRLVLPVVDGLDELDPEPSSGPPRRAIGLLAELNRYSDLSGRRPGAVVVTCRADRHAELRAAGAGLDNAALIRLRHLNTEQIGTYLRARWPDGHPFAPHRDAVHAALSGPAGEAVHAALATPWRLLLTVTAVESGGHPDDLLHADPDADPAAGAALIAGRLLDAYVPAATHLAPRTAHGTPYRPDQVRSWLVRLAAHLHDQSTLATEADRPRPGFLTHLRGHRNGPPPGLGLHPRGRVGGAAGVDGPVSGIGLHLGGRVGRGAGVGRMAPGLTAIDLVPHLLWPIGGRRRVRVLHSLGCVVFAVIAMLAFWTGSAAGELPDQSLTLALMAGWVVIATVLSLAPWPAAAGGRTGVPRRRRVTGGLVGALGGVPVGVLGGLTGLALTGGRAFGPGFAVVAGGTGGLVLGAVIGLTAAGRPGAERMTVPEAIRAEPLTLLGFGLCGALTGLPPLRLAGAGPLPLAAGVAAAFVLAFALGVVFTIATGGWSKDAELAHPREALHRNAVIGLAFGLIGGVAAFLVFLMKHDVAESLLCALVGGVTFGLAFGAIAWARTMIGLAVAAARGLLPLRLWAFLDWACEANLLRVSGATYQFRHRELQDFLTPGDR